MKKQIYRDFDHYWAEGNHGFSSMSKDLARETWEDFETTINATKDDYKKAYVELMNEKAQWQSDLVNAMLTYIKLYAKEDAPKFWKWYLDQKLNNEK
jgi:DnaJ-domain-containing protein 1